jgi:hypothetical protein
VVQDWFESVNTFAGPREARWAANAHNTFDAPLVDTSWKNVVVGYASNECERPSGWPASMRSREPTAGNWSGTPTACRGGRKWAPHLVTNGAYHCFRMSSTIRVAAAGHALVKPKKGPKSRVETKPGR